MISPVRRTLKMILVKREEVSALERQLSQREGLEPSAGMKKTVVH